MYSIVRSCICVCFHRIIESALFIKSPSIRPEILVPPILAYPACPLVLFKSEITLSSHTQTYKQPHQPEEKEEEKRLAHMCGGPSLALASCVGRLSLSPSLCWRGGTLMCIYMNVCMYLTCVTPFHFGRSGGSCSVVVVADGGVDSILSLARRVPFM